MPPTNTKTLLLLLERSELFNSHGSNQWLPY